ncbi:MAG: hypothetical protein N2C14_14875 [Planctomycetales bacterium]
MDCVPVLEWTPHSEHWQSQWHTTTNPFSTCFRESNNRLASQATLAWQSIHPQPKRVALAPGFGYSQKHE